MLIAVVIPVFNEARWIRAAVDRIEAVRPPFMGRGQQGAMRCERVLVLVDDGSTDGSAEIVKDLGQRPTVKSLSHSSNRGKGAALRTGIAGALREGADVVIIHDADLEYDPDDHEAMLRPILDGRADAVIGSRFLGQAHRVLYYWHAVANRFITTFSNMLTNLNLTDIECCLKAFRREVLEALTIEEDRFSVEPELIAKLAALKLRAPANPNGPATTASAPTAPVPARIYEVPVSYAGRTYADGKKITWPDGLRAVATITKYNLFR